MSLVDYIEKKRLEREKEIRNKMRKGRVKTFAKIITGASLGASLGILFAPKSGKETRKDIKNKAVESKDFVVENVNEVAKNLKEKANEIKDIVNEKYEDFSNRNMTEISPETLENIEKNIEEKKEFSKDLKEDKEK